MPYIPTSWVNDGAPPLSAANLNKIEQGIADAHTAAAVGATVHHIFWTGSAWTYLGEVIAARPAIPAWPAAWFVWHSCQHATMTSPPAWAVPGDEWHPHGSVLPVWA
jgi:hypothetical protein